MSVIIQYVGIIDETTGVIISLNLTGGGDSLPSEGRIENSEPPKLVVHLKSSDEEGWAGYTQADITEQFWWNGEGWQKRGGRPGPFYIWNVVDKTWDFVETEFLSELRRQRNFKLSECDWTQTADCQLSDNVKGQWRNYRQQLRDIPSTYGDEKTLEQVGWPAPPDGNEVPFI